MSALRLETDRLLIRPFMQEDLNEIHRILGEAFEDGGEWNDPDILAERKSWLQWSILNETWLARLHQPPYGDRAVVHKVSGALVGAVGFVPLLDRFDQIAELGNDRQARGYFTPEVGLFWAIDPAAQGQGYATEAARALVEHAFRELRLRRILAKTEYANAASQAVMRKLGMRLARNPLPEPSWLQIVGILENPV